MDHLHSSLLVLLLLTACGDDGSMTMDSALPDTGGPDTRLSPIDGGADTSAMDTGPADTGPDDTGVVDATADGATDGAADGATDGGDGGAIDGATDGAADGATDGAADGATDGAADGATDGGDGGVVLVATWTTEALDMFDCADAGVIGSRHTYSCPPGGSANSIWGTDTYTHDSSICTAGVHVGSITLAAGGLVTIEMAPGLSAYVASTRNGISSGSWGAWGCSFIFP
jgi:hypothetical protein